MGYFVARFGDTSCEVQTGEVEALGGTAFFAQVFMIDEERRHVHELRAASGKIQAFFHPSEAGALALAVEYLRGLFGPPDGPLESSDHPRARATG